jgi:hypothetical protein
MGGYGSGRHEEKYCGTIEGCRSLNINDMIKGKWIEPGHHTSGIIRWHIAGKEVASIRHDDRMDLWPPYLRRYYTYNKTEHYDYKVHCTTTKPYYEGLRYWFLCPSCNKRVGKLYLAEGQRYFTCRVCQNLTYQSCRDSHKLDRMIAMVRGKSGISRRQAMKRIRKVAEALQAYQFG